MSIVRRYIWILALAFGIAFLGLGVFFVSKGLDAKAQIRAALAEEAVTTSKDAINFGGAEGVPVLDAKTAEIQANVIKFHTLGTWGPYSKMARDDPNRATYLSGVALRTSLNLAVLGFGVADMAIGTGAVILLLGFLTLAIGVPALYWAKEAEGWVVREVTQRVVRATPAQPSR